jgi:hypothetical protein
MRRRARRSVQPLGRTKTMKTLRGRISNLRASIDVSGGGGETSVVTTHIHIFRVDGAPVKVESREPFMLDDGDTVTMAGSLQGTVFRALAYRNESSGASGDAGSSYRMWSAVASLAGAAFALFIFTDPFFGHIPKVFAFAFAGFAYYNFHAYAKIRSAVLLLQRGEPETAQESRR